MGRGNCCVTGQSECLFYIDNDDYVIYSKYDPEEDAFDTRLLGDLHLSELKGGEWKYNETETHYELDQIVQDFTAAFREQFPSFTPCEPDTWLRNGAYGDYTRRAILENKLFYVCLEDNEWSMAVELIQKDPPWGYCLEGLQAKHAPRLRDGMMKALFTRLERLGVYAGPWTSGMIQREAVMLNA